MDTEMSKRQLRNGGRTAWCAALLGVLSFLPFLPFPSFASATAPFVMPPNAVVSEGSAEGGWRQSGEMALSYRQTRAQFGAKFAAAGWRHRHTIPLAKDRTVESWERAGSTLTFMIWGQAPNKTGFSWGLSRTTGRRSHGKDETKKKTTTMSKSERKSKVK